MLLFERNEKKLEIALDYLKKLEDFALKNKKYTLLKSVQNCLKRIKEI